MPAITRLNISNFRNYEAARIVLNPDTKFVVISGKNGAGKTNLLEAISMFNPGRGLRSANLVDLRNRRMPENHLWSIAGEAIAIDGDPVKIGTGLDKSMLKRVVRINGADSKSQSELSEFLSVIWLTPQMDKLFLEGSTERRKFLDRLVSAYEPIHSSRISKYEKLVRERIKLLQESTTPDAIWLDSLEKQMAENAVSIAASRINLVEQLKNHIKSLSEISPLFPEPRLELSNMVEESLINLPAVQVENKLIEMFRANRILDAETKRTNEGAHKLDLKVFYDSKNMPADLCSTGEQKALLISIILGHAIMMQAEKGFVPIILLDEIAAHLDDERRKQLFSVLASLNGQIWLTGTDADIFTELKNNAKFFNTDDGVISEIRG